MLTIKNASNGWIITDEFNQVWLFLNWPDVAKYLETWAIGTMKKDG